jgi:hypothetical protein
MIPRISNLRGLLLARTNFTFEFSCCNKWLIMYSDPSNDSKRAHAVAGADAMLKDALAPRIAPLVPLPLAAVLWLLNDL